MNPANWFEIPVNDIDQAVNFYKKVFGYDFQVNEMGGSTMAWFPGSPEKQGATGTLIKGEGYNPSHDGSLVYFSVEKIEETLAKVTSAGGKALTPKIDIGEYGVIAHFEDCEGNRVALHSVNK